MGKKSGASAQSSVSNLNADNIERSSPRQQLVRHHDFSDEDIVSQTEARPTWKVILELASDRSVQLSFSVTGELALGRGEGLAEGVDLDLYDAFDAEALGVSHRHAMLRSTTTNLYVLDLGSTNGTRQNGRSIGTNVPSSLNSNDLLALGNLEFVVRIIERPTDHTAALYGKADLGDALAQLAKAITSQLDLDQVLSQALEMAMELTAAGETAIWLVDEQTGELFLEAERGIQDEHIKRMRLPVTDTIAGQVIEDGQPRRVNRSLEGEKIKVKTGYMVEALLYVPLALGGAPFGVLAAALREPGEVFSEPDEKLLVAIADFAAIAIHNSRLHQATNEALAERMGELIELNSALAHDLRSPLASIRGFAKILGRRDYLNDQDANYVDHIVEASERTLKLLNQLLDIALLGQTPQSRPGPCDLTEAVSKAVDDLEGAALEKSVTLNLELEGTPYQIEGDATRLYRSVLNLVDNAIKHSPEKTEVSIILKFGSDDIVIQVRDAGPGIPEDELARVFERYYRVGGEGKGKDGIGLGLAIAQAIAKTHGGEIVAGNVEGGGAEFTFTLPAGLRVSS